MWQHGVWMWTMSKPYLTLDRKSTRLNSSHANISYAVFCLKKKKNRQQLSHCLSSRPDIDCPFRLALQPHLRVDPDACVIFHLPHCSRPPHSHLAIVRVCFL